MAAATATGFFAQQDTEKKQSQASKRANEQTPERMNELGTDWQLRLFHCSRTVRTQSSSSSQA